MQSCIYSAIPTEDFVNNWTQKQFEGSKVTRDIAGSAVPTY